MEKRGLKKDKSKISIKFKVMLIALAIGIILLIGAICCLCKGSKVDFENRIAVIKIDGAIGVESNYLGTSGVSADKINSYLEDAAKEDSIKGILIEINSPGGAVIASEEIATKINSIKTKKPVVAFIKDTGASGAYWIASSCNKIVAYPMSITGSIGVIGSYLDYVGLMEKYGVNYNQLIAGKYKDIGSPYTELTPERKLVMQNIIDEIYNYFVEQVSKNRNLDKNTVKGLATGMVYLGKDAKDLKLIDYLGDKEYAVNITKQLANISEAKLVEYKEPVSLIDILRGVSSESFYFMGKGLGNELFSLQNKNSLDIKI
ncbi:MAG: signal peptide peptidase SppA [Candidatus Nanoarchaeia archaeon]|nr:signal peptide peptidase SppA [Candidatus Nanoarchaeia archaeon]MDD5588165.1 signal peptide peptidase SppA [Candidatus Nanoarchaeia archaeon]